MAPYLPGIGPRKEDVMYLNSRYATGHVPSPPPPDFRNEDFPAPGPDIVTPGHRPPA